MRSTEPYDFSLVALVSKHSSKLFFKRQIPFNANSVCFFLLWDATLIGILAEKSGIRLEDSKLEHMKQIK